MLRAALFVGLAAACGGSQKLDAKPAAEPPVSASIADGERELTLGNPGRAIKILEKIGEADPAYAYAQQLLGVARQEVNAIAKRWLSEIDLLIATQQYNEARSRCRFLLHELPIGDAARTEVERRLEEVEVGIRDSESMLEDTAAQARDYLLRNDHEAALRTLRSVRSLVWEIDRDRALVWERIISAADMRLEKAEGGKRKKKEKVAAKEPPKDKKKKGKSEPDVAPAPEAPAAEPSAEQLHIGGLVRQAEGHLERKDYFRAIQAYLAVLKVDRAHADVAAALKELEPQRIALVKEYLDKAQEHFLRQNLAAAAPYYKRVLVLEPGNEPALQGLKMHDNLERIRRESAKDKP